jgi:hypothetical protein
MNIGNFMQLTSSLDTPLYVRRSAVLVVEGFTFNNDGRYNGHVGSQLTLKAGQWTERVFCIDRPEAVIAELDQ